MILLDLYKVYCLGWLIFLLLLSFSAKASSVLSKEQKEHNEEWKCVNEVCSKDAQPEKMTWNVNDMTRIRIRSYLASVHAFHFSRLLVEAFANSINNGISYCCGCGGSIKCTVFGLSVPPIKCISSTDIIPCDFLPLATFCSYPARVTFHVPHPISSHFTIWFQMNRNTPLCCHASLHPSCPGGFTSISRDLIILSFESRFNFISGRWH